jgi:hypothetical protein
MRIRSIVFASMVAGAVALATAGCTGTAEVGNGQGAGRGAQAGGRYTASADAEEFGRRSERRETVDPASDRTGREVAETGELRGLSGELAQQDGEWYLEAAEGRYLLHLGNTAYVERTGIDLEAGEKIEVRGLVDGDEVSVVSIVADGKSYAFRSEDGVPLWAGNGRGSGGGDRTGASQGGRGRATRTDV